MSYTLHTLHAAKGNYGAWRDTSTIRYLVIHYTGNHGDTAENNAKYYSSTVVEASAHYFVDDTTVWRSVPDDVVAWAVGGKKYANSAGGSMYGIVTNSNSISIEICGTGVGTSPSAATLQNAYDLTRALMEKYNIPLENMYRHYDVTGKACPAWAVYAADWEKFKANLMPQKTEAETAIEWVQAAGIMTGNADGDMALNATPTRRQIAIMLYRFFKFLER